MSGRFPVDNTATRWAGDPSELRARLRGTTGTGR